MYRKSLSRFDKLVLEQAWQRAAEQNAYWCWPTCDAVVQAAEHFHAMLYHKAKVDDNWVEKATGMVDSYARRFMKTSAIAARATDRDPNCRLSDLIRDIFGFLSPSRAYLSFTGIEITSPATRGSLVAGAPSRVWQVTQPGPSGMTPTRW